MIEYLIKTTDGSWFDFPKGSDPYRTTTIPFARSEGWGDGRIEIEGCLISFSYEDPGVQVSFEGEIAEEMAASIVEEIRTNVERVSSQSARSIRIA